VNRGDFIHGRNGYIKYRCSCDTCLTAHRTYQREYARRRSSEAAEGGRPFGQHQPASTDRFDLPKLFGDPKGDWVDDAACAGHEPTFRIPQWHTHPRGQERKKIVIEAKQICATCPVLDDCRNWILNHTIDPCPAHVVAGLTKRERTNEKHRLGIRTAGRPTRGDAA
jgi:hypothetical protein